MAITTSNATVPAVQHSADDTSVVHGAAAGFQLSRATLACLPATVKAPTYDPANITAGILHLGTGNFMLAHLGSYVHDLLATDPRWGIVATSIRTDGTLNALKKQDGAYVVVVREYGDNEASVLAPIVETMFGPDDPNTLIRRMAEPNIKLVTITVSNKGYHTNQGGLDTENADIRHDLYWQEAPRTIYAYLKAALKLRQEANLPLTIMSLDNIERNSASLKIALQQFIYCTGDEELMRWIEDNVDFPVTLVDRITPEVTDSVRRQTREEIGFDSHVLVGTEAFRQLVVERSRFEMPDWESVGVQVVDSCQSYWQRKFICLNAGHQVVAIPGQRLGVHFIHEAMSHSSVARLLARAHREWLTFLPGDHDELSEYCKSIRRRFADEALGDSVQRVAARATSKVSQRLFYSALRGYAATDKVLKVPVFVSAVWLNNLGREDEFGEHIALHDADAEALQDIHADYVAWVRSVDRWDDEETLRKVRCILSAIGRTLSDPQFGCVAEIDAMVKEFAWALVHVHQLGVEKAIDALLAR